MDAGREIQLKSAWIVVNPLSRTATAADMALIAAVCAGHGVAVAGQTVLPGDLPLAGIRRSGADALIILGGDGTLHHAASMLNRRNDPAILPLPGGTMNMLPHRLLGARPWAESLQLALARPRLVDVPGIRVQGRLALVAAIFGEPALWARAREEIRASHWARALRATRLAWARSFSRRILFRPGFGHWGRSHALLVTPAGGMAEIASFRTRGWLDAIRLGADFLASDWRGGGQVDMFTAGRLELRSGRRLPALLDGELHFLEGQVTVDAVAAACRMVALETGAETVADTARDAG